jgi:hypothetical protein
MSAPGKKAPSTIARWRERRRPKHQAALEREFHQQDRLDPTAAHTSADNHARRWTSFLGSGGGIG